MKNAFSSLFSLAIAAVISLVFAGTVSAQNAPASDPSNSEGWLLNTEISDEFNGTEIDHDKWFVQGKDNKYYIWKGRAPAQFAAHNVILEGGILKLRSQWEPDFNFAKEDYAGGTYGDPVAPVTTAAIISKKRFLNGYMEVRSKAAKAAMTSSFWMIGYESELDVYEQMGAPKKTDAGIQKDSLNSAIHDWRPGRFRPQFGNNKSFNNKYKLGYDVADEFHVYGCEWDEEYLKFYVDGKLVREVSRKEIGDGWVLTNPLEVWLDSEIFRWLGYPTAGELPADFEIDYVRVWQKPETSMIDRAFFGFEGPILFEENPRPLDLVPESSEENDYQKFWYIDQDSKQNLSIPRDPKMSVPAGGNKSLRFQNNGALAKDKAVAFAPFGSVKLPSGDFAMTFKVRIEPGSNVRKIHFMLEDPWLQLRPIDLSKVQKGKWVKITQEFSRKGASGPKDRMRIIVKNEDIGGKSNRFYIDDIKIMERD